MKGSSPRQQRHAASIRRRGGAGWRAGGRRSLQEGSEKGGGRAWLPGGAEEGRARPELAREEQRGVWSVTRVGPPTDNRRVQSTVRGPTRLKGTGDSEDASRLGAKSEG